MTGAPYGGGMALRPLVAAALLAALGCYDEDFVREETLRKRDRACSGLLGTAPGVRLPAGLPAGVGGARFYETVVIESGETLYRAHLAGADFAATRDAVRSAFERSGFTVSGDWTEDYEAGFRWADGGRRGDVAVRPYCAGRVTVQWAVAG